MNQPDHKRMPGRRALGCALVSLLAGALFWLGGCRGAEPEGRAVPPRGAKAAPQGPRLLAARYRLAWIDGAAAQRRDGRGFTVVNDLGYTVTVDAGYLVSHSVSLAPCAGGPAAPPPSPRQGLAPWLPGLFSIPSAYAGHGGPADPSAITVPHIEDLSAPGALDLGEISFPAAAYCKVHYLVARADARARDLPRDVDLLGVSLHLTGSIKPPGGAGEAPLSVHTSLANGALLDIQVEPRADMAAAERATITVQRELGRLFDGIDFSKASAPSVGRSILTNLVNHTHVHVALEPPQG